MITRRTFLQSLGLLGVTAAAEPPRRVYSFLWDNPLVREATDEEADLLSAGLLPQVRERVHQPLYDKLVGQDMLGYRLISGFSGLR